MLVTGINIFIGIVFLAPQSRGRFLFHLKCCSNSDSDRIAALEALVADLSADNVQLTASLERVSANLESVQETVSCGAELDICGCPLGKIQAPAYYPEACIEPNEVCRRSTWDSWRLPTTGMGEGAIFPSHYEVDQF